jgi:hypothetical protein
VAFYEARERFNDLAHSSPGPARRLRRIIDEGEAYVGAVSPSGGHGDRRLASVHRLLLITSQAQSILHNYQARGDVNAVPGAAAMGAVERLADALAETSAIMLGLVPQVTVAPEAEATPTGSGTPDPDMHLLVTVALANNGSHSVRMVRIGLAMTELPGGVRCSPEDTAVFGSVAPGQTVRAAYHLRYPAALDVPDDRCAGDISYFASSTPAHLRPRAW